MTRTSKKDEKHIMKAYQNAVNSVTGDTTNVKRKKQQQIQILEKVHLAQDEFTQHQPVRYALIDFVVEALELETHYQAHQKNMIRTVALRLEDELKKIGKPELVCRISEELIKILKQVGLKWNPIYLRRCLDERYKDPTNRANALARKTYPGVPEDSGRTVEELQAALQAEQEKNKTRSVLGEYVVKSDLKLMKSFKSLKDFEVFRKNQFPRLCSFDMNNLSLTITLPAIVRVNAKEQDARIEIDEDTFNHILSGQGQEKQSKSKPKPNPDSKKSMSKEEMDQIIDDMKADLPEVMRSLKEG